MKVANCRLLTADRVAVVVLLLVTLFYLRDAVLMRGTFFAVDVGRQNFPIQVHFSSEISAGRLPLWTPQLFCGFPLNAEGQGGLFYPLNLLFYIRPASVGLNLYVVLHTFLAGLFVYWLARTMRISAWGALLAGMAFSLSALVNRHHGILNHFGSLVWLPVPLAMLNCWVQDRRRAWALLGGLVLGVQWLASHPQYSWFTHLALGLLLVFHWLRGALPGVGDKVRGLGVVAVMVLIGLGLAMVQLLPMRELAGYSERSEGMPYQQIVEMGLDGHAYLDLLSPRYFGALSDSTALWDLEEVAFLFIGIIPLLLVLYAFRGRQRGWAWALLFLAGVGVFLSLEGSDLASRLLAAFPPANLFRYRMRYALFLVLALVLLAARGLDGLLTEGESLETPGRRGRRAAELVGLALMGLAAVWLVYAFREGWLPDLERSGVDLDRSLAQAKIEAIRQGRQSDMMVLALFWGVGIVTLLLYALRFLPRRVFVAVVLGQFAVNAMFFGAEKPVLIDRAYYTNRPETLKLLEDDAARFRVFAAWEYPLNPYGGESFSIETNDIREAYCYYPLLLSTDLALLYDVDSAGGFPHSLRLRRYQLLERYLFHSGDTKLLRLMNVKYVFSVRRVVLPGLVLIHSGKVKVYEVPRFLPRAFVVHEWVRAADEADAFDKLTAPGLDPATTAVVECEKEELWDPAEVRPGALSSTRLVDYQARRVEIEVRSEGAGLLVLADANYPGWVATVDDEPVKIYQTDYLFRGVVVGPGVHRVTFDYRPVSFLAGLGVSGCTAVLLAVGLVCCRWRKRPGSPDVVDMADAGG